MESASARGVLARGLGRSYGDAAQNAGGLVLDMTGLAEVYDFDAAAGTITVGAGISLDAVMRVVVPAGWFLAVTPGTRFVTVGGAIAGDVHGKNHHRDGGFCGHTPQLEIVTPAKGSMILSPETTPEEFGATAGGMGLTGVITRATLRLIPIETATLSVDFERAPDIDAAMDRMEREDAGYRYSVAWVDCLALGRSLGRAVLTRGDHSALADLPPRLRSRPRAFDPRPRAMVPPVFPSSLLRPAAARAFNEAWYRRAPARRRRRLQSIGSFFHPLDAVRGWNRIYGRRGFIQYQLVVPSAAGAAVRRALEMLAAAGCPSFLGVVKRFGPGRGSLSFPIEGWTMAVDIPSGWPGLGGLLDRLDDLVAEAGGRVYLSKDARMRPEALRAMYPDLEDWVAIRDRLDPSAVMRSDLARRLLAAAEPAWGAGS